MFIKITPLDTLFFRTGRPFTAGEDTWAETIFPPNPSTIYGAIRSLMIFKRKGGLKKFYEGNYANDLGTPDKKGNLKIKGPLLYKDELFYPTPLDLVIKTSNKKDHNKLVPLKFTKKPNLVNSDYPLENILIHKSVEKVDEPRGFLTENYFLQYLKCESNVLDIIFNEKLYILEPKIGIARDKLSLSTIEGFLYGVSMVRMKEDVSMVIQIEGINDFPDSGVMQLGGKSKGTKFEKLSYDLFFNINKINYSFESEYFKIYLATPAIFEKGWIPKWINKETLEGEYNGIKLKLVACVIGRPRPVGGWDIAQNRAKPLQKAVPEGSVYYFRILKNSDWSKIKDFFHLKNISDINPEEGFGLSLVGEVKI